MFKIGWVLLLLMCCLPVQAQILPHNQQLIVVTTPKWQSVSGKLLRFERDNAQGPWQQIGQAHPIVVGRKGMGWGRGVFAASATNHDFRQEGDQRAPAGIFSLGTVFGLAPAEAAAQQFNLLMPYLHLSDQIQCVGDPKSQYYNEIVDTGKLKSDWRPEANERMRHIATHGEGAYRWGVFVNHNHPDNPPGMQRDKISGSCIFLHLWQNAKTGTSGCTAMAEPQLLTLIQWLDPQRGPLLVQLPDAEYQRLQASWHLPELKAKP